MKATTLALALVALHVASTARAYTYRGINMGDSKETVENAVGKLSCITRTKKGTFDTLTLEEKRKLFTYNPEGICDCSRALKHTIAGIDVQENFKFNNDRLISIQLTFRSGQFENLLRAFSEKYGTPRIHHGVAQNGFGAILDDVFATWPKGAGGNTLSMFKLFADSEGVVFFETKESEKARLDSHKLKKGQL